MVIIDKNIDETDPNGPFLAGATVYLTTREMAIIGKVIGTFPFGEAKIILNGSEKELDDIYGPINSLFEEHTGNAWDSIAQMLAKLNEKFNKRQA